MPATEMTCPRIDCYKAPPASAPRDVDLATLVACSALEAEDAGIQRCWRKRLTDAEKREIDRLAASTTAPADTLFPENIRGCPDRVAPFHLQSKSNVKAVCAAGASCDGDTDGKRAIEQPQACPAVPVAWEMTAWRLENPDEPPCNRNGRDGGGKGGVHLRDVSCPAGAGRCREKDPYTRDWVKPATRKQHPYARSCYEWKQAYGRNVPEEWGDCKSTQTNLKCGAPPFVETRATFYHGAGRDEDDCGRHTTQGACGGDCAWDAAANVCNNRNIIRTTYNGREYFDRKPVWKRSCAGKGACRWEMGPLSACKSNSNQITICGKSEAKRTVTCSGGAEAGAACAASAGCAGIGPGGVPLPALTEAECLAKGDQCIWNGRQCRNHSHGAQLKIPCQSNCPYTVSTGNPNRTYYVLTPDTSKAVKDFVARQEQDVIDKHFRYYDKYDRPGSPTTIGPARIIPALKDTDALNTAARARGETARRQVTCGFLGAKAKVDYNTSAPAKTLTSDEEVTMANPMRWHVPKYESYEGCVDGDQSCFDVEKYLYARDSTNPLRDTSYATEPKTRALKPILWDDHAAQHGTQKYVQPVGGDCSAIHKPPSEIECTDGTCQLPPYYTVGGAHMWASGDKCVGTTSDGEPCNLWKDATHRPKMLFPERNVGFSHAPCEPNTEHGYAGMQGDQLRRQYCLYDTENYMKFHNINKNGTQRAEVKRMVFYSQGAGPYPDGSYKSFARPRLENGACSAHEVAAYHDSHLCEDGLS